MHTHCVHIATTRNQSANWPHRCTFEYTTCPWTSINVAFGSEGQRDIASSVNSSLLLWYPLTRDMNTCKFYSLFCAGCARVSLFAISVSTPFCFLIIDTKSLEKRETGAKKTKNHSAFNYVFLNYLVLIYFQTWPLSLLFLFLHSVLISSSFVINNWFISRIYFFSPSLCHYLFCNYIVFYLNIYICIMFMQI